MEEESVCPASRQEWRQWLAENHATSKRVWLICYKKHTKKPSVEWSEAVDEALCFGWIDSVKKSIDDERYKQQYTRRKPKSPWSRINKEKVAKLIDEGKMMQAGFESIEIAKKNGSWSMMDDVEALKVPEELTEAFDQNPEAKAFYDSLRSSYQKGILTWITQAKRQETKDKRIAELVECLAKKTFPKVFTQYNS